MKTVRSNPSGKKTKVNELMKRLEFVLSYDKDMNDPLSVDYVKEVLKTTTTVMKEEGILTMPENWVLYTLHCIIFNNVMFAVSDTIYRVYSDLTEKYELDGLIAIQDPTSAFHYKNCFEFSKNGDLSPFLWMILDNDGNIPEDQKNADSLFQFATEFREQMTKLTHETNFGKVIGLFKRYYNFFQADIDIALSSLRPGDFKTKEPMDKITSLVHASEMEKKVVTQIAHFWGQASVLEITKIKKHPMLPQGTKSASTFYKLMLYFRTVEHQFVAELEKERGNKFVSKNYIDWGTDDNNKVHPVVALSWKTNRGYIFWESLGVAYSEKEGRWALHCGNSTRSGSSDNIFSLREQVGEKVKILVTVTAERKKDGTYWLRESKGVGNFKPKPEYWDFIVDLFLYFDKFNNRPLFSDLTGGGYWVENNLNFQDLAEKQRQRIIDERPDLVSGPYFAIYKRDGFLGLKHLVDNYKKGLTSRERASDQLVELLSLFFYPDGNKTTTLKYNFFGRRQYENETIDQYYDKGLKSISVKSFNAQNVLKTVPLELFEDGSLYEMDAETVGAVFGNMDEAVRKLMGDRGNKLIERLIGVTRQSWHKYPRKSSNHLIRVVYKNEIVSMIDKGIEFRLGPISEQMINYLNEYAPHVLPDRVLERLTFYDFLMAYGKKHDLLSKKQTEDDEVVRHASVKYAIISWVRNHDGQYDAVGSISQEDAKNALKKFPFLKENKALLTIAEGNTNKAVKALLAETRVVKGKEYKDFSLTDDKEGLIFEETDDLNEIYQILGNDEVEHLYSIYKDGHYDIGDIGMTDRQLRQEISSFSGYVYKHAPKLYNSLTYWFEEMDEDSPEWDTDDGIAIFNAIRSAYFSGYESGAYSDCIEALEQYMSERQLKHSVNFQVTFEKGVWKVSLNIIRLKKIFFDYWMEDMYEHPAFKEYLQKLLHEDLENPSFRSQDITTFDWDASNERFLDELREHFGDVK